MFVGPLAVVAFGVSACSDAVDSPVAEASSDYTLASENDTASVEQDRPAVVNVMSNDACDVKPCYVLGAGGASHGSTRLAGDPRPSKYGFPVGTGVEYLPSPGYVGRDRFSYDVTDDAGNMGKAWVDVVVTPRPASVQKPFAYGPVRVLKTNAFDDVLAGDLDGDHRADLVFARSVATEVALTRALPSGTVVFDTTSFERLVSPQKSWGIPGAVADVSGDGRAELIGLGRGGIAPWQGVWAVAFGDPRLTHQADGSTRIDFAKQTSFGLTSYGSLVSGAIGIGDLDGDGKRDALLNKFSSLGMSRDERFVASIDGRLLEVDGIPDAAQLEYLAIADFDGDGRGDLVYSTTDWTARPAIGRLRIARNVTAPGASRLAFAAPTTILEETTGYTADPHVATFSAADLDGDGVPEIAICFNKNLRVLVAKGAGLPTHFEAHPKFMGLCRGSVSISDLNGDGRPDVLYSELDSQTIDAFFGR